MAKPDTVEYRTFLNCTDKLALFLKKHMRDLALFLLQEGFILPAKHVEVSSSTLTDNEKADRLLSCIRDEIKMSSKKYHQLVDQLRNNRERYSVIVNILDEEFRRLGGKAAETFGLQEEQKFEEKMEEQEQKFEKKLQEQESKFQEQKLKYEKELRQQEQKFEKKFEEQKLKFEKNLQEQEYKLQEEKLKTERKFEEQRHNFHKLLQELDEKFVELQKKSYQNEVAVKEVTNFISLKRTFTMENYSIEKEKDEMGIWKSPAMYTHLCGYRFCVGIDANGWGDARGKAMLVWLYIMQGEHDQQLKWPANASFTVELLHQHGGENKRSTLTKIQWKKPTRTYDYKYNFSRIQYGIGTWAFLEHSKITEFLAHDTFYFHLSNIIVY